MAKKQLEHFAGSLLPREDTDVYVAVEIDHYQPYTDMAYEAKWILAVARRKGNMWKSSWTQWPIRDNDEWKYCSEARWADKQEKLKRRIGSIWTNVVKEP